MKGSQSEEGDLEWHAKGAKIDCTKAKKNKDYLELRIIQSWVESKNIIKKKNHVGNVRKRNG